MDISYDDLTEDHIDFKSAIIFNSSRGQYSKFCAYIGNPEIYGHYNPDTCFTEHLKGLKIYVHSLVYLDVLYYEYKRGCARDKWSLLFKTTKDFVRQCCYTQIRYCPGAFCDLLQMFAKFAVNYDTPLKAISTLSFALDNMNCENTRKNTRNIITAVHSDLFLLCLRSNCLKPALKYLDIDMNQISPNCCFNSKEPFLLYFYYGAIIYIVLENFERACLFLEIAATTHNNICSNISLQAYNKYRLTCLLAYAEYRPLPSEIDILNKNFMNITTPYVEMTDSFSKHDLEAFNTCVNANYQLINEHGNISLVQQVRDVIKYNQLKKIRNVFTNISLSEIAENLNENNQEIIEKHIMIMVEKGDLQVSIDCRTNLVRFPHHHDFISSEQFNKRVIAQIEYFNNYKEELNQMISDIRVSSKNQDQNSEKLCRVQKGEKDQKTDKDQKGEKSQKEENDQQGKSDKNSREIEGEGANDKGGKVKGGKSTACTDDKGNQMGENVETDENAGTDDDTGTDDNTMVEGNTWGCCSDGDNCDCTSDDDVTSDSCSDTSSHSDVAETIVQQREYAKSRGGGGVGGSGGGRGGGGGGGADSGSGGADSGEVVRLNSASSSCTSRVKSGAGPSCSSGGSGGTVGGSGGGAGGGGGGNDAGQATSHYVRGQGEKAIDDHDMSTRSK